MSALWIVLLLTLVYLLGAAIFESRYRHSWGVDICPECGARPEEQALWWPLRELGGPAIVGEPCDLCGSATGGIGYPWDMAHPPD